MHDLRRTLGTLPAHRSMTLGVSPSYSSLDDEVLFRPHRDQSVTCSVQRAVAHLVNHLPDQGGYRCGSSLDLRLPPSSRLATRKGVPEHGVFVSPCISLCGSRVAIRTTSYVSNISASAVCSSTGAENAGWVSSRVRAAGFYVHRALIPGLGAPYRWRSGSLSSSRMLRTLRILPHDSRSLQLHFYLHTQPRRDHAMCARGLNLSLPGRRPRLGPRCLVCSPQQPSARKAIVLFPNKELQSLCEQVRHRSRKIPHDVSGLCGPSML